MPVFTFTTIDVSRSGTTGTSVFGINGSGDIAGTFRNATGNHGFIRFSGGITGFIDGPPGTSNASVRGINDQDQIVGDYQDASGIHGFRSGSGLTTIDVAGALQPAHPTSTTQGRSSGGFSDGHAFHGFVRFSSGLTGIIDGPTGTTNTVVRGINDQGAMVGSYQDASDDGFRRRRRRQLNCSGAGRRPVSRC